MATQVGIGLIGAGRIGASHARVIAERVPGARLVAVADPARAPLPCSPTSWAAHRTRIRPRW